MLSHTSNESSPTHTTPVLDGRHRAPTGTLIPSRRRGSRRARELVNQPPESVRTLRQLPAREAIDPRRQTHGDIRVVEVQEHEVELHLLDLGVPGGEAREQLGERVLRRQLGRDIVPGELFQLLVAVLRAPSSAPSVQRRRLTHLYREPVHRLGRADRQLGRVVVEVHRGERQPLRSQGGERDPTCVGPEHDSAPSAQLGTRHQHCAM